MYHFADLKRDCEWYATVYEDYDGKFAMFINLPLHEDKEDLKDTIAHECIHMKHPELDHGRDFDASVKSLVVKLN